MQKKYSYQQSVAPYALLVKYYLRVACYNILTNNRGGNLGSTRGKAAFLRITDGAEPTKDEMTPIDTMLCKVQDGVFDEQLFAWSNLGVTKIECEKGSANTYFDTALKPMLGTTFSPLHITLPI